MNEPMVTITLSEYQKLKANDRLVMSAAIYTHDGYDQARIFYNATDENVRKIVEGAVQEARKDFLEYMEKEKARKSKRWWQ
jgi:hypothetical protein